MGAIKYENLYEKDKKEVLEYKKKILEVLEDKRKVKKAAQIIEKMIQNKSSNSK